jgi:hypothetical protein
VAGVKVVELDPQLEVLFDDVLDRDRRFENVTPRACSNSSSSAAASRSMASSAR